MATIGHIQEFDPEKEKVSAYLERVQMFLVVNSIEAEKKVPVLLSVTGGKTYALLGSLLAPEDVRTVIQRASEVFRTEAGGDRSEVSFS